MKNSFRALAKPGGNLTGFTNIEATMGAKYLQLLKDVCTRRHARRDALQSELGTRRWIIFH